MELSKVESSNIAEIGYDANTGKVRIRFKSSGGLYEYDDVPKNIAEGFLLAESKGKYFHQHIKNEHPGRKVVDPEPEGAANDANSALEDAKSEGDAKAPEPEKKPSKSRQRRRRAQEKNTSDD